MIRIPSNTACHDIAVRIEVLRDLVADLKSLRRDSHPAQDRLAAAPFLLDWRQETRSAPCLVGTFSGHPIVVDGHVGRTGELWVLAPELGYARTMSRLYRLGGRAWNARQ